MHIGTATTVPVDGLHYHQTMYKAHAGDLSGIFHQKQARPPQKLTFFYHKYLP
jgi:hypothetical protein